MAQHALDNALLDAIHAVRSKITACRSSWIEENAKGRDRVELAPVWETAWKEVWRDVSKQLSSLNNRNAQQWEELWDQVCAEKEITTMCIVSKYFAIRNFRYVNMCKMNHY